MHKKFCFICGKQSTIEGLCEECWGKRHKLVELPEKLEFIQCPKCNLVKIRNNWVEPDLGKIIRDSAKLHGKITAWGTSLQKDGYEITACGEIEGIEKKETHKIRLHAIKNICPVCGRVLSGYYEAIIQVRGEHDGRTLEWLEREAERIGRTDSMAFIRRETVKGGTDYFFGSKKAAKSIAMEMKKKFNAELTESFQVAGRKDGKELVRTIISVRCGKVLK